MAPLGLKVRLARRAIVVLMAAKGHKALPEMMVPLVLKALPVTMELLDRRDRWANVEVMVLLGRKVPQAPGHQILA